MVRHLFLVHGAKIGWFGEVWKRIILFCMDGFPKMLWGFSLWNPYHLLIVSFLLCRLKTYSFRSAKVNRCFRARRRRRRLLPKGRKNGLGIQCGFRKIFLSLMWTSIWRNSHRSFRLPIVFINLCLASWEEKSLTARSIKAPNQEGKS